jgi:hypothetical protein
MSKTSDLLKQALNKKKGIHHIEPDATSIMDNKGKPKPATMPPGKKPVTRSAGRGR